MDKETEVYLVEKAKAGDVSAFNSLARSWNKRVFGFSFRYFGDYDEATEATQKTFIKCYQSLKSLKDNHRFQAWIYIIAGNICRDMSRSNNRFRKESWSEMSEAESELLLNPEKADKLLNRNEIKAMLQKALAMLPEEQKIVVIMKEYEGFKFHEIAEILDESENTVKSRLYYGLKTLRKILSHWNIDKEALDYENG